MKTSQGQLFGWQEYNTTLDKVPGAELEQYVTAVYFAVPGRLVFEQVGE